MGKDVNAEHWRERNVPISTTEHEPQVARVAYVDESYSDEGPAGFYILAATLIPAEHTEAVREQMLRLRPRPTMSKLHWKDMEKSEEGCRSQCCCGS